MTTPVRTVPGDVPVQDAARILWRESVGSLVVVGESIRGIVTESDVVHGVGAGHDPERLSVAELMTTGVVTVQSTATVRDVAELMVTEEVKRVPVTEDGDPVGMVTTTDLAHSLAPSLEEALRTVE